MDFRQLRYFLAVARSGSITKAAEQIPLAQSALSRHLRLLEDELGTTLLIRTGRGVELTEQGEFLSERAQSLLDQVEDTKRHLVAWDADPAGLVRLGVSPTVSISMASQILQSLRSQHPKITVQLTEGLSSTLSEWIDARRLDLAIVFEAPRNPVYFFERIATEELRLCVPVGHACPDPVSIAEIGDLPLIAPFETKGIRNRMTAAFDAAGVDFAPTYELDTLPAMKELVRVGAGVSILASSACSGEVARGELESRRIDTNGMSFDVYLMYSKAAEHARAARSVATVIRDTAADVLGDLAADVKG